MDEMDIYSEDSYRLPFESIESGVDQVVGNMIDLPEVHITNTRHLFRYVSEFQKESKGGYLTGIIQLPCSLGEESNKLELSLAPVEQIQNRHQISPNLVCFVQGRKAKGAPQPKDVKLFYYDQNSTGRIWYCHWRLVLEWNSRTGSLNALLEQSNGEVYSVDLSHCLDQNTIVLGTGKLQLSIVTPKLGESTLVCSVRNCLRKRLLDESNICADEAEEEDLNVLEKIYTAKNSAAFRAKVRIRLKWNIYEIDSATVVFDQKRFGLDIRDVSQSMWCSRGQHEIYIITDGPVADEVKPVLLHLNKPLSGPLKYKKINSHVIHLVVPAMEDNTSYDYELVMARKDDNSDTNTLMGNKFPIRYIRHELGQQSICACHMKSIVHTEGGLPSGQKKPKIY